MGTDRKEVSRKGELAVELHDCGGQVEAACRAAESEILLAAPFVKADAFGRLLKWIRPSVPLTLITRWRLQDIASRVLDPEIWPMLVARGNARLFTRYDLHAKYYRADEVCVVGSANLTCAALGWSDTPNFEVAITLADSSACQQFEALLMKDATLLDAERYCRSVEAASALQHSCGQSMLPNEENVIAPSQKLWIPLTRDPTDLWRYYCGAEQMLTGLAKESAASDLEKLGIRTTGLSESVFSKIVANQVWESALVRLIDAQLDRPRRFGEIRDAVAKFAVQNSLQVSADRVWQTLMRWLLYFFPERYELSTPKHSEIFRRRGMEE